MNYRPAISVLLVTLGVAVIVLGTLSVVGGVEKIEAARGWEESVSVLSTCTCVSDLPADATPEDFMCEHQQRCSDRGSPENPFAGGELDVLKGVIVALIGGTVTYSGFR